MKAIVTTFFALYLLAFVGCMSPSGRQIVDENNGFRTVVQDSESGPIWEKAYDSKDTLVAECTFNGKWPQFEGSRLTMTIDHGWMIQHCRHGRSILFESLDHRPFTGVTDAYGGFVEDHYVNGKHIKRTDLSGNVLWTPEHDKKDSNNRMQLIF